MYYNGDKILNNPMPFNFTIGIRGIGKSFYWKRYPIKRFIERKEKFCYVRRYVSDIQRVAPTLFDDISPKFPKHKIEVKNNLIYVDEEEAGWCIAVSEFIKYKSKSFKDCKLIIFDEFLPEDGKYLGGKTNPNLEVELCLNFYQTVARGYNNVIDDSVKFIFIANSVTINNPYFLYFDIDKMIKSNTKFIKGNGFNVEISKLDDIANQISTSKFGQLINGTAYGKYALDNDFYLDSDEFVSKIGGNKQYLMTFKYNGQRFGLWRTNQGVYYLTTKFDKNCKNIYSLSMQDHDNSTIMINRVNIMIVKDLVKAYATRKLYFDSQRSKSFFDNAINK